MFAFFTDINRLIDSNEINNQSKQQIISALEKFDNTLVIMDFSYLREESAPADILDLLNARNDAKKNKNFAQADALRDEILKRGWKIVDTKEKTFVESLSSK
jgi:cysteinyl-tRNA synthetase